MEQNTQTQYSFGVMKLLGEERSVVRVKSKDSTPLNPGCFYGITEDYPDMIVTHTFKVDHQVAEDTDAAGYTYKWYTLTEHNTTVDRSPRAVRLAEQNAANLDYVCMMAGIDIPTDEEGGTTNE